MSASMFYGPTLSGWNFGSECYFELLGTASSVHFFTIPKDFFALPDLQGT